jgi:type VI secretion system protein ImpF
MARPLLPDRVIPALFDRLGREGGIVAAPGITARQAVERLHADLAGLLNTRRTLAGIPDGLDELAASVLTYGLADFTALDLQVGSAREAVRSDIALTIRRCEPRLSQVRVELATDEDPTGFSIGFRIAALFRADPETVPVKFVTHLQRDSKTFVVEPTPDGQAGGDGGGA